MEKQVWNASFSCKLWLSESRLCLYLGCIISAAVLCSSWLEAARSLLESFANTHHRTLSFKYVLIDWVMQGFIQTLHQGSNTPLFWWYTPHGFARFYTSPGIPPCGGVYFVSLKSCGGAKNMGRCRKKILLAPHAHNYFSSFCQDHICYTFFVFKLHAKL